MNTPQFMQPKTAITTIVVAFFMATVAMGLGRAVIDEPVAPNASYVAAVDAPATVISVQY